MSPKFGIANPDLCNIGLRSQSLIPEPTRTVEFSKSTSRISAISSRETRTSSVTAIAVNECPEPTTLTFKPRFFASLTIATTSSSFLGFFILKGLLVWFPAQLLHVFDD